MSEEILYRLRGIKRVVTDGRLVLDIEDLEIPEGSLTAVVGPNGSGKTTLLTILAFLVRPEEGEIVFRGKRVEAGDEVALRRIVTMVHQAPLLFHGSVFKNVAYGLRIRRVPRSQWEGRVREALALVDLEGFERRSVKGLSGGETQRVALARSLVFRPEVVLLDEATAGVDAARVEMVETLIQDVSAKLGASIILSTHNLAQAYRLTDRVIHMSAGRVVRGGMDNLFSGHGEHENGWNFIRLRSGPRIAVPGCPPGAIRFMIPSASIDIAAAPGGGEGINRYEGTVTRMEIRGRMVRLRVAGELGLRAEMAPEEVEKRGIRLGGRVVAVVPPEAVQILDS